MAKVIGNESKVEQEMNTNDNESQNNNDETKSYRNNQVISKETSDNMGHSDVKIPKWANKNAKMPKHVKGLKATQINVPYEHSKDRWVYVVKNVLTKDECNDLIKITENIGYEDALVNIGGGRQQKLTDIRNHKRTMIDSFDLAEHLYQRIKGFIPEMFNARKRLSFNERLRFLKYFKGEYFAPHFDGTYIRKNGERSQITILLYLNDGYKGGCTTFLNPIAFTGDYTADDMYPIKIEAGMVLMFEHAILHEGSILEAGIKYCMRTDVMFSKKTYKTKNQ